MPNGGAAWIDISVPLRANMTHWPGDTPFHIERRQDMDRGDVCNLSELAMSVHTGTHMDAPLHFVANGRSIDQMPLTATVGPARVIEIADPKAILPAELEGHEVRRGERLLFKTANSRTDWLLSPFREGFVHISAEAAEYLVTRGVQTIGVDYISVGAFTGDGAETHRILLGAGVWIVEGLNLSAVQPGACELICLPLRILNSDGAPARALLRPMRAPPLTEGT